MKDYVKKLETTVKDDTMKEKEEEEENSIVFDLPLFTFLFL